MRAEILLKILAREDIGMARKKTRLDCDGAVVFILQ